MENIKHILEHKTAKLWSIEPQQSVFEAIQTMAQNRIGALLVFENKALSGIITERDYARKVIVKGKSSHETMVKDIMSTDIKHVSITDSIDRGLNLMTDHYIRHLPVINNDQVVGIVSIGDLVKAKINSQQQTIQQLEHYIHQ